MKKNKKLNFTKLSEKKYSFLDLLRLFYRHILDLVIFAFIGTSLGCILYVAIPNTNYTSSCRIEYSGNSLDEYQQARIVTLLTCNESLDKYVASLASAGVKYDGSYYTFSDLNGHVTSSIAKIYEGQNKIDFSISLNLRKKGYTGSALKVMAERAVQELQAIYPKDTFIVLYNSFTAETSYKLSNANYLTAPIAISVLIAFIYTFIADGLNNIIYDVSDCRRYFKNTCHVIKFRGKKNKEYINQLKELLCSDIHLIINKNDLEAIDNFFTENDFIKKTNNNNSTLKQDNKCVLYELVECSNEIKLKKNLKYSYIVVLGKSKYSEVLNDSKLLFNNAESSDNVDAICIDYRVMVNKNVKK